MLVRYLKPRCEIIYEANDGAEALKIVKECVTVGNHIDVIIMDHEMPEMDGLTACKLIRNAHFRSMIIGLTGKTLPSDLQLFINNGADYCLTKPLDTEKLNKILSGNLI
jgi:CheY-like chemotaxis protein